jgi:hypothetical protein
LIFFWGHICGIFLALIPRYFKIACLAGCIAVSLLFRSLVVFSSTLFLIHQAWALEDGDDTGDIVCNDFNIYGNPYFGDTHAHTRYSFDAYIQGSEITPDEAYRYAKGETLTLHLLDGNGDPKTSTIDRALDFAMVSDHAELLGEQNICLYVDPDDPDGTAPPYHPLDLSGVFYNGLECSYMRARTQIGAAFWLAPLTAIPGDESRFEWCVLNGNSCSDAAVPAWGEMQSAAEQHYDRSPDCSFTTFVGYEWSGSPSMYNENNQREFRALHRNVVFRNSFVPDRPISYLDESYRENLWTSLKANCQDRYDPTKVCDVFTIPHNSNQSQGMTFETTRPDGMPYTALDAQFRRDFEPLAEIFQRKGQSECMPSIMGSDEFCNFEFIPWGGMFEEADPVTPKEEGTLRHALKEGLSMHDSLGTNPFTYGFIGSTDTHLGTAGLTEESVQYPGVSSAGGITDVPEFNPGGLAVVWAPQNSRAALFDAMRRRETYATSGPRHIVRFYGGWGDWMPDPATVCSDPNLAQIGYDYAVPMGGTLPASPGQGSPTFALSALMDAGTLQHPGYNLQRIQIIKGWTDISGETHEQVFDVGGDFSSTADVDLANCSVTGDPGHTSLCEVWTDPEFDADQRAFYYARVLENPSCRWSHRQCLVESANIDCDATPDPIYPAGYESCCDTSIPKTVQERSWASPIWYNPPPPVGC